MAKILTVINERKASLRNYRKNLEDEYVQKKRDEFLENYEKNLEVQPEAPEIDLNLLREKYRDLRNGVDNIDYIYRIMNNKKEHILEKQKLNEKYDYRNKIILKEGEEVPEGQDPENYIKEFSSMLEKQLNSGDYKLSSAEVMRAHFKNWRH